MVTGYSYIYLHTLITASNNLSYYVYYISLLLLYTQLILYLINRLYIIFGHIIT